jgi:sugar lactone lactonase YvrE
MSNSKTQICRAYCLPILLLVVSARCFAQVDTLKGPEGLAVDKFDNLFIADTSNNRVLRMDHSGKVSIVAGTGVRGFSGDREASTKATLNSPKGLVTDQTGNLFIAASRR